MFPLLEEEHGISYLVVYSVLLLGTVILAAICTLINPVDPIVKAELEAKMKG